MDLAIEFNTPQTNRTITWALLLSFFVHLLLIFFMPWHIQNQASTPIEIALELEKPAPRPDYVSPSAITSADEPKDAAHLSEHNSITEREQIKRGEIERASAEAPAVKPSTLEKKSDSKAASASPKSIPEAKSSGNGDNFKLKLGYEQIEKTLSDSKDSLAPSLDSSAVAASKLSDDERLRKLLSAEPFNRIDSSNIFSGAVGSPDFLPDVKDGEVTLLNAKADRFAVFVRRVALQVFGNIRRSQWHSLSRGTVNLARSFVTFEAVLSPQGDLIKVLFRETSGASNFDAVVKAAVDEGAWDKNPPSGALAADGNVHFVFKAKIWSTIVGGDRPSERRWILLSTGLL